MFYFLFNKNFRWTTVLLVLFGVFLYFIDVFAETFVSAVLGFKFYYAEEAFLKLIFLLIGVVSLGILSGLDKNHVINDETKQKNASFYALSLIVSTLVGLSVHLFFVVAEMKNHGTLYELEDNLLIYYLPHYFLVLGFLIGGWRIRRLEIIKRKKE
jgi:uncharacterized membrane protein (Fun14 family)